MDLRGRNKQRIKTVAHGGQKLLMFGVGHSIVVVWNMKNDSYWLVLWNMNLIVLYIYMYWECHHPN